MTNDFVAHHEAGHAVVAEALGFKVESLSMYPTPHCATNTPEGASNDDIAAVCMAGAAATYIHYGTVGPCDTDVSAALTYVDSCSEAMHTAVEIIMKHDKRFYELVEQLVDEVGRENQHGSVNLCVDTINTIRQNGPSVDANQLNRFTNQGVRQ